jgi:STE24 endopeptidase
VADPAAQADVWLARLPAPQLALAQAHTDVRLVAWLGGVALLVVACAVVSRSGVIGRLGDRLQTGRPRPWLADAACAGLLTLILALLKAGFDAATEAWSDSVLSQGGGAPAPGFAARLAEAAGGVLPVTIAAMLFLPPLAWLARRRPKTWPLFAGAGVLAVVLLFTWAPYALSLSPPLAPAPPGPVRDSVARLIAETGIPAHQVWASTDPALDADVTGGFGAARVSIGPELLAAPPAETTAYVAHIMGHYAHGDVLNVALLVGFVLAIGLFAVQRFAAPLARLTGARAAQGPADPAALPAAALILVLATACALLASGAYLRWANVRADAYSLDHARAPDGLATVLEREWDHASVDPSPLETAVLYTHPPLKGRLQQIAAWKAAHGG